MGYHPLLHLGVLTIEKGAFGSPRQWIIYIYLYIYALFTNEQNINTYTYTYVHVCVRICVSV